MMIHRSNTQRGQAARLFVLATMLMATLGVVGLPTAQAQAPISTTDLRQIVGNPNGLVGIQYNREVGLAFQKGVLLHLAGLKIALPNTKPFASPARNTRTGGKLSAVVPDGVAGACEGTRGSLPMRVSTYPESTFVEVKAVNGTITLAYGRHQIAGMLDVLTRSPAASSTGLDRAFPNLYFVTTADTIIANEVYQNATNRNILVWLSAVIVVKGNQFVVMPPVCVNCNNVLIGRQVQNVLLPGLPFTIASLGFTATSGLDIPILDDGLIGSPGAPGLTGPNI